MHASPSQYIHISICGRLIIFPGQKQSSCRYRQMILLRVSKDHALNYRYRRQNVPDVSFFIYVCFSGNFQ